MQAKLDSSNIEDIIPLTSMQEGMLFHYMMESDSLEYHEQISLGLVGKINSDLLQKAWNFVIEENEMLRTIYRWKDINKPVQVILKNHQIEVDYYDISEEECLLKEKKLDEIRQEDFRNRIDIEKETLRIALCKCSENEYTMIISNHHILFDGWSSAIMIKELINAYHALYRGLKPKAASKSKFSEYVSWIGSQDQAKQKVYWENYLSDVENSDTFFSKAALSEVKSYEYSLCKDISNQIKVFAKENSISVASFFYGVWGILAQKLNNTRDIVIGTTISGRDHPINGIENMIGLFINTIPLRIQTAEKETIIQLLKKINETTKRQNEFGSTPLVDINAYSGISNQSQLFNSLVVIENYPLNMNDYQDEILRVNQYSAIERTNYNLTLGITIQEIVKVNFRYNCFSGEDMIVRIGQYFESIISAMIADKNSKIIDIDIMSTEEREKVLYKFNDTYFEYPRDKMIHQLFEEQVVKTPDNVALEFDGVGMTYADLNVKSNQLARTLQRNGVRVGEIIGIMMERSFEMIIGIMGILKSGGAYLPIDPDYPKDRITFMLEDSGVEKLLTQSWLNEKIEFKGEKINLDECKIYEDEADEIEIVNNSSDLAYVIYTSGSTGKPKGVMIEHRNVVNLAFGQKSRFDISEIDRILQFSSISFDASVEQIFIALFSGATLYLVDDQTLLDNSKFRVFLYNNAITHIHAIPSFLEGHDLSELGHVKRVIGGGEVFSINLMKKLSIKSKIYNEYGPTEATVTSIMYQVKSSMDIHSIPIGKPISNYQAYILNADNKPLPIGVVGELFIGGDGVARGYLNRPELTTDKFVVNPFVKGERMYRTGDQARWLSDGNIEFLGRIDHQIKIRGFRIELGEIENRLLELEAVKEAAVIAKEDKARGKYLCAYVVTYDEIPLDDLRRRLSKVLPDYMIPSYFVGLGEMPLTSNGKVDRKALPEPKSEVEKDYVEPKNDKEKILAKVFEEILSVGKVGAKDDFFTLGGDSIKSIRIISKLREAGYELSVQDLMKIGIVDLISKKIRKREEKISYEQEEVAGGLPLTPIQRYFFTSDLIKPNHFNQSIMLKASERMSRSAILTVLDAIVKHHDILRAVYRDGKQEILRSDKSIGYEMSVYDYRENKLSEIELAKKIEDKNNELQASIDIESGPLMKVGLFKTAVADHLMICIHHLVVDGVSWRIFIEDLEIGYKQYLAATKIKFPEKTASFKIWSESLNDYSKSDELKQEMRYWRQIAEGMLEGSLQIATVGERGVDQISDTLSDEVTSKLLYQSGKAFGTEINDILLSSLGIAIQALTGQKKVTVSLEGHGREPIH